MDKGEDMGVKEKSSNQQEEVTKHVREEEPKSPSQSF